MSKTVIASLILTLTAAIAHGGDPPPVAERYHDASARIIGAALTSSRAYDTLAWLCDHYPLRLSGSTALDGAIAWAAERMRGDGFSDVHAEKVMVPHWVRGEEGAWLVEPIERELMMLGLGRSVGTPPGGLTADVVVVTSFDQLEALGVDAVKGKVVLYDVPFTTYGETVEYRGSGGKRASKLGAVAALVRSVGPVSLATPHTGATAYPREDEDWRPIPIAALTLEDASALHRMYDRGETVRVHLEMGARTLDDAPSANVVADLPGSELADEVVVVGGHLDSWDVGQGAQDDGVGCVIAWEAARLLRELDLRPRRTVRVVLFTNEENGLRGGKCYAATHYRELERHVAALEADFGNGPAAGFTFHVPSHRPWEEIPDDHDAHLVARKEALEKPGLEALAPIAPLLAPLGADTMRAGHAGADVSPTVERGVPGLGLDNDAERYFDIHHTPADTFDKIDKATLDRNVAAMAIMVYVLADMPGRLPRVDALGAPPIEAVLKDCR